MNQLTAIDIFSGCGGSAQGFKNVGFDIRVAVDNDHWSTETYKRNHKKTLVFNSDIRRKIGKQLLKASGLKKGQLSVLLACPPCQGFSYARSNGSPRDPRDELVFEFVRLAKEMMPVTVAMENVPGLSRGKGKDIFTKAVTMLKKLGYQIISDVLSSSDFGVPQNRKRVILLGSRMKNVKLELPSSTHGNSDGLKPKVTVKDAIGDLPHISYGKKNDKDPMHVSANLSEINLKRLRITPHDGGGWKDWPMELRLNCHKKANSGHGDVYGRMRWNDPSPTLTGGCTAISKGRFGHPKQDRAISLREAARIQSFPDIYKFEGSFTKISKQIGNAVPPLLAENIANSIKSALNTQEENIRNYYGDFSNTNKTIISV